jgi:Ca2+-binding EF-hand superfamily protein
MGLELPGRLVNEIMKEADKDLDGFISYHEFIETFKSD